MTDRQIEIAENNRIHDEAVRLLDKYAGAAATKALYRARTPGDFYDRVSIRILWLERCLPA